MRAIRPGFTPALYAFAVAGVAGLAAVLFAAASPIPSGADEDPPIQSHPRGSQRDPCRILLPEYSTSIYGLGPPLRLGMAREDVYKAFDGYVGHPVPTSGDIVPVCNGSDRSSTECPDYLGALMFEDDRLARIEVDWFQSRPGTDAVEMYRSLRDIIFGGFHTGDANARLWIERTAGPRLGHETLIIEPAPGSALWPSRVELSLIRHEGAEWVTVKAAAQDK